MDNVKNKNLEFAKGFTNQPKSLERLICRDLNFFIVRLWKSCKLYFESLCGLKTASGKLE